MSFLLAELYDSYLDWAQSEYGPAMSIREFDRRLVFHDVKVRPGIDWETTFYNLHYSAPLKLVS